ncbi:hypothetical protein ACIGB8_01195 [Promicromonospora sukumoe]|uniref:hypothetical protein n=1 Tax=Promicromonospora sukumoe TaxID=88382 RepID=UPI0037C8BCF4
MSTGTDGVGDAERERERERDKRAQGARIASWRKHGLEERGWAAECLIEHQGPASVPAVKLPRPIPTRCTARAYDGTTVTMVGVVTQVRGPWRSFSAEYPGWGEWSAVVHRDACEYLDR